VLASPAEIDMQSLSNAVVSDLLGLPQSHGVRKRLQHVFGFD